MNSASVLVSIDGVEALNISHAEREQIFDGNARTLLKLGDEVISKQGVGSG
jgi:predicted TIM-barrel fold metal-dependent hydrolase